MKIVHPDKWLPCDGITLEEDANTAIRCSDRHVLVIAGPGAGKTELLAQKAAFLFQTNQCKEPQKILAISFKTDAAQNLKERVEQRCGAEVKGRFISMTYDAFAKSILDHFLYALPEELRPSLDYSVNDQGTIDAAFRYVGYNNPNGLRPSKLRETYDFFLSRINLPIIGNEIGHRAWPVLLKGFNGNNATLTFKMIMMLAIHIVKTNPYIKHALQMTYSFVFLDEFQDTTGIQYAFVKECFFGSDTKITAVGDNKQRIMVWAGAVKRIFNIFCEEWNPKGVRLQMNHRSAPRLVALQKAMYNSLNEKTTEVSVSDRWDEDRNKLVSPTGELDIALNFQSQPGYWSRILVNYQSLSEDGTIETKNIDSSHLFGRAAVKSIFKSIFSTVEIKNLSVNFAALFHFYFSQNILLFDRYAQFSSQLEYLNSNTAELLWLACF